MARVDINHTHYDKLDILETFDGDIEALRRNLAKRFHPDTGKEPNAERMKEINNACDVLADREQRQAYDDALRRKREEAHASSTDDRQAARPHTSTSPPPPPPPPPRPPPPPSPILRPPTLSMRLWFVPAFIPIVGPVVSWTYAAIAAASRRFARWAFLYWALLAFLVVVSATSSGSSGGSSSHDSEWVGVAFIVVWIFGPMVQVLRRRREVIDAIRRRRLRVEGS
jgi:DnaJ domain